MRPLPDGPDKSAVAHHVILVLILVVVLVIEVTEEDEFLRLAFLPPFVNFVAWQKLWTNRPSFGPTRSITTLSIIQRQAIFGVPDLLIELISPSSVRRDRYLKKDLYARFGVKEYWIGDPANKALEILTLKAGQYQLHCFAEEKGKLASLVLPGFEFDLAEIQ